MIGVRGESPSRCEECSVGNAVHTERVPPSPTPAPTAAPPALPGGTPEEQDCLTAYALALSKATGGVSEVLDPLRGLLHADVTLADEVWTRALTVAWSTFTERRRVEFAGVAGSLLAKPWHTKAMNFPPLMQGSPSVSGV